MQNRESPDFRSLEVGRYVNFTGRIILFILLTYPIIRSDSNVAL